MSRSSPFAIRLRPFSKEIEGASGSHTTITGSIVADQFVVSAFGQLVPLRTDAIGSDRAGAIATVVQQEHELAGRIRLLVAREYDEEALPGGQISIDLPIDPDGFRHALETAGVQIAPDRVNVVTPIARGYIVYFDADGRVNGSGWVGG